MSAPITVTDETFADVVLESDKPVLVDFWAAWCPPCRRLEPVLEEIAAERADKLTVVKLNIDENPTTAVAYGILAAPTLGLYRAGEVVHKIVGARPKGVLLRDLDAHL